MVEAITYQVMIKYSVNIARYNAATLGTSLSPVHHAQSLLDDASHPLAAMRLPNGGHCVQRSRQSVLWETRPQLPLVI